MNGLQRNQGPRWGALAAAVSAIVAGAGVSPATRAQAQPPQQLDEILVTGSRIARRDFTAASPIVTVEAQTFENSSTVGVESVLNQLPQFVPGGGAGGPGSGTQFGSGDVQASAFNSPGISSLNLRGLGPNRNLVLVDGRRAQPANATLVVDVNTIPAAAIQNVEVISGGASAVYGADAIGGVVNFILKDDFQGIDLDFQTGSTQDGGGEETRFSALLGGNFNNDRSNVMLGVEYARREAVREADRDFYVDGWNDPGTPGTEFFLGQSYFTPAFGNAPSQAAVDAVFANHPPGSVPAGGPFYVNDDNTVFFRGDGGTNPQRNYNGPLLPLRKIDATGQVDQNALDALVSSPLDRYSLFGRASYALNDNLSIFVQGNFSSLEVGQVLQFSPAVDFWSAQIPRDAEHPVPPQLAALLDSRPDPAAPWTLNRVLDFLGPRASSNESSVYQVMFGVEGNFTNRDWTWDAYASHGETEVLNFLEGFASLNRYLAVVQAPNYGANLVTDAGLGYGIRCSTGLPIFSSFAPSQDCIDAITANMKNTTDLTQDIVEVNLQGGLIEMAGSELRFAVGASYRRNEVQFEPDLLNDAESIVDSPVGLFAANNTGGKTEVSEIYGELLVPATERLSFELGYRYSDYNTSGGVDTYKALFDWAATDGIRVRGGRQVANRAANTAELFTGPTLQVVAFPTSDPCTTLTTAPWGNVPGNPNRAQVQSLCAALIGPGTPFTADPNAFTGPFGFFPLELEVVEGNPALTSESAVTYTLGVVLSRNSWNLAVDLYDIEIKNAIAPLDSMTAYERCFNSNGTSNPTYSPANEFCQLIARDPVTGGRQQVDAPYLNLGGIQTSGVDVQANWQGERFTVNFMVNYLNEYKTQTTPGSPFFEAAGTLAQGGQFDYRTFTTVGYNLNDALNFGLRWRHLPGADDESAATDPTTTVQGTGSYNIFDFFGGWRVNDTIAVRFGIDNLLDEEPEVVGFNPPQTNARGTTLPGFYDPLGRRAYVGVKLSF